MHSTAVARLLAAFLPLAVLLLGPLAQPATALAAPGVPPAPFSLVKNLNQGALSVAEPGTLTAVGDTLYFVQ